MTNHQFDDAVTAFRNATEMKRVGYSNRSCSMYARAYIEACTTGVYNTSGVVDPEVRMAREDAAWDMIEIAA